MCAEQLDDSVLKLWEDVRDNFVRERVLTCAKALAARGFAVIPVPTASEANRSIVGQVSRHRSVYYWEDAALEELGILETLSARGNQVRSLLPRGGWRRSSKPKWLLPEGAVFLTGVCAATMDGMLVKVEPEGVPVFGPLASPDRVIIVAGVNTIVDDIEDGFRRAKDICVPNCARRLGLDLPCIRAGHCVECDDPHPMCSVHTVLTNSPARPDVLVVLIGELLGF